MQDQGQMVTPTVQLDVLALMPTLYRQCTSCEIILGQTDVGRQARQDNLNEYPEELLVEHQRLSEWVTHLAERHGPLLRIRLIDPHSTLGLWKSLRHRIRRYPTWLVNGRVRIVGWDSAALDTAITNALEKEDV